LFRSHFPTNPEGQEVFHESHAKTLLDGVTVNALSSLTLLVWGIAHRNEVQALAHGNICASQCQKPLGFCVVRQHNSTTTMVCPNNRELSPIHASKSENQLGQCGSSPNHGNKLRIAELA